MTAAIAIASGLFALLSVLVVLWRRQEAQREALERLHYRLDASAHVIGALLSAVASLQAAQDAPGSRKLNGAAR